jgi:hypothetical protein
MADNKKKEAKEVAVRRTFKATRLGWTGTRRVQPGQTFTLDLLPSQKGPTWAVEVKGKKAEEVKIEGEGSEEGAEPKATDAVDEPVL